MAAVTLPGGVVSMSAENADRVLALGQGDSALLYLALLRHGGELAQARRALGWTQGRLDGAYGPLQGAGLVGAAPAGPGQPLREAAPPDYLTGDVASALGEDASFAALAREVERQLGKLLSPTDLKQLYTIYDYLALPPEVILVLTAWCVEEMERKYGQGRRPRMAQVKKEAFRWRDRGVDTLPAAEGFLRAQKRLRSREAAILPLVGVRDRQPLDREREYIATWVDWGFSDGAIELAYQKTLMKKQAMSWPYMNSILKSWHGKGLHTPREIEAGDRGPKGAVQPPADPARAESRRESRMARNIAALKRAADREN